jgi:hypothetical protein
MIKLKLTRSQLFTLCRFTNPATYEAKVMAAIKFTDFKQLPQLYTIIQIGEAVSKKCLYSIKDKYTVSLKYAEGAALFAHTFSLLYEYPGAYDKRNMTATAVQELSTADLQAILDERLKAEKKQREEERNSYENIKEETILNLAAQANAIHEKLKAFKEKAFADANTLYELLQQYSKRHADGKGSFTVQTADGIIKMSLKRQQLGKFDERSVQAEKHIKDFILNKFGGDADVKDMIMGILERKKGYLDINQIQRLYAMENRFDDVNWKEGIKLLKESWQPSQTKDYLMFTVDNKPIVLDFASI